MMEKKLPEKQEFSHATLIGIDVGLMTFATLSTGEKIDNPKFLKNSLERLKCLQRRVSRRLKVQKTGERQSINLRKSTKK